MTIRADLCATRSIAKRLCRSASTISRELKRTGVYDGKHVASCRDVCPICARTWTLFQVVRHPLKLIWSPQKIASKLRSRVGAKVAHPFQVIKRQFGFMKVSYRGLKKNTAQRFTLFALSNLWMVRSKLRGA